MQGMIGHHAQANTDGRARFAGEGPRAKTTRKKRLALRIDASQQDEIKMMESVRLPRESVSRCRGPEWHPAMNRRAR
jgi:uncharacterized protein (DUF305 family)